MNVIDDMKVCVSKVVATTKVIVISEREDNVVNDDGPLMSELNITERDVIKSQYLREPQLQMLVDTTRYVDDTVIEAANILLRVAFNAVYGFEDTLFQQKPQLRTKHHPTAVNIFHGGIHEHFVSTVYIETNNILYMDTLTPGGKPPVAIVKQMRESYDLKPVFFFLCEKKTRA